MSVTDIVTVIFLGMYVILSIILHLDPRIPVMVGLGLLCGAAIMLAKGNYTWADSITHPVILFLGYGAILLLIEHAKGQVDDDSKRDQDGKGKK